jgi:hypothetical protein
MRVRIQLVRRSQKRGPAAERIPAVPKSGLTKHFQRLRTWEPRLNAARPLKLRLARASPKD